MKDCKILINLDCVFDTILGTVETMYPKLIIPLLENNYLARVHNNITMLCPEIDLELFRERYKNRDMEILRNSKRTHLVSLLAKYINEGQAGDPEHPGALNYKLVINTYPYEFSKEELKELFTVMKLVFNVEYLNHIHIPIEAITPNYIRDNQYNRFVIYDLHEWLTFNRLLLKDTRMPLVTCSTPLIYIDGKENEGQEEDAIRWITAGLSPYLDVEFMALADVSIDVSSLIREEECES